MSHDDEPAPPPPPSPPSPSPPPPSAQASPAALPAAAVSVDPPPLVVGMSVPAKSATAMAAVAQTVPVSAAGTNGPTPVLTHEFGEKTRAAQTARPTSTTTKDVDIDSEGTALEALANVARGSFSAAVRGVSGSQFPAETGDVNESTDPPMGEAPDSSQMTAESASAITGPVLSERARRLLGYGLCITVAIILLAVIGAWAFG